MTLNSQRLKNYFSQAVQRSVCTKLVCTTCRADEFRSGLLSELRVNGAARRYDLPTLAATELASALRGLDITDRERQDLHGPAQYCVFLVATSIGELQTAELLSESWAGSLLRQMQAHSARRDAERRDYEARNNPAAVAERRQKKRQAAQEAHAERLAKKVERDRLWREKQAEETKG